MKWRLAMAMNQKDKIEKKVSVAMATYNGEKYIKEQLITILNQTRKPNEIIICDDCSSDRTVEYIKDIEKLYPKFVKLIQNNINLGFSKNFEKACRLCSGEYIFFADQDDVWELNRIEQMLNEWNSSYGVFFSDATVIDEGGNRIFDSFYQDIYHLNFRTLSQINLKERIMNGNLTIYGYTMAVKKELLDECLPFVLQHDQTIPIVAALTSNIGFCSTPLTKYRQHSSTVSSEIKKSLSDKIKSKISLLKQESIYYFGNPNEIARCYAEFDKRYSSDLKHSPFSDLLFIQKKEFYQALGDLSGNTELTKINIIRNFLSLYRNGNYRRFRGDFRQLVFDIIFLIAKK